MDLSAIEGVNSVLLESMDWFSRWLLPDFVYNSNFEIRPIISVRKFGKLQDARSVFGYGVLRGRVCGKSTSRTQGLRAPWALTVWLTQWHPNVIASSLKQGLSGQSLHLICHCILFGPSLLQLVIMGLHKNSSTPSLVHQPLHRLWYSVSHGLFAKGVN